MSKYSNEEDENIQREEGFSCGYSKFDTGLYELSDAEPDAGDDTEDVHVRFAEAPEDVEGFVEQQVKKAKVAATTAIKQAATKKVVTDSVTKSASEVKRVARKSTSMWTTVEDFFHAYWMLMLLVLVVSVVGYFYYMGQLTWPFSSDTSFSLGDSQDFVGSSSSLGRNVVNSMRRSGSRV